MNVTVDDPVASIVVNGISVETIMRGRGRPLLFLHPGTGIDRTAPVLDLLARGNRLIAPSHPGFGRSELPKSMTTIDDLAYFYLDFLDALDLRNVIVVGVSLGGWIAAEIAVKSTERLSHLVLADAVGIKVGDREARNIVDIYAITEDQFTALAYVDPSIAKRDVSALPDADLLVIARNREAATRFGWSPYMHDPKLKGRLHRIRIPTLLLWGAGDRIVAPDYGRAYGAAIPGARFELIEHAGHFPHVEQPRAFVDRIQAFIAGDTVLSQATP